MSEAVVRHSHNYSITQDFKRYFDIGVLHETQAKHLLRNGGLPELAKVCPVGIGYDSREKKYYLLPEAFLRNLCKFIAYKAGRRFNMLPGHCPARFSMNPGWWH